MLKRLHAAIGICLGLAAVLVAGCATTPPQSRPLAPKPTADPLVVRVQQETDSDTTTIAGYMVDFLKPAGGQKTMELGGQSLELLVTKDGAINHVDQGEPAFPGVGRPIGALGETPKRRLVPVPEAESTTESRVLAQAQSVVWKRVPDFEGISPIVYRYLVVGRKNSLVTTWLVSPDGSDLATAPAFLPWRQ